MLEEIRTCLREAGPGTGYHQPVQHGHLIALRDAYTPALIAALEAILTDHRPDGRGMCTGCAIDLSDEDEPAFTSGAWRSWPCPTYLAIARELLGGALPEDVEHAVRKQLEASTWKT